MNKTIICGAGISGLVSAIHLASDGKRAEIFEKNSFAGGKMNELRIGSYRFDTGPSQIIFPWTIENFFRTIGRNIKDYIEPVKLDASSKYFWNDGTVFNSYTSGSELQNELKRVFGENEKKNFYKYLDYGKLFYNLSKEDFLKDEFRFRNYFNRQGLKNFTKFISGWSMNDLSNKFFKDKRLRQVMNRYSAFNGSSPYLAPQFFSIIPFVEHQFGSWTINGGMIKLTEALVSLCKELDVKINFNHELTGIISHDKKIISLLFNTTEGQSEVTEFRNVISNFTNDVNLMGKDYFENFDWSSSGFMLFIGMKKTYEDLGHFNVLFSDDSEKEYIDIFEKKIPADDMTINITITSKINPGDAPQRCENWIVFVNAPGLSKNFSWSEVNKTNYKNKVIERIDSFNFLFGESIRNHMEFCEVFTPEDFLKRYNSERGSIYGLSNNSLYSIIKRPRNISRRFNNLFFTGGNTHPGGSVPLCFLSGKIAANLIR